MHNQQSPSGAAVSCCDKCCYALALVAAVSMAPKRVELAKLQRLAQEAAAVASVIFGQLVQCIYKGQPYGSKSRPSYRLEPSSWRVKKGKWASHEQIVFEWVVDESSYLVHQVCTHCMERGVAWPEELREQRKRGEVEMAKRFKDVAAEAAKTMSARCGVHLTCQYYDNEKVRRKKLLRWSASYDARFVWGLPGYMTDPDEYSQCVLDFPDADKNLWWDGVHWVPVDKFNMDKMMSRTLELLPNLRCFYETVLQAKLETEAKDAAAVATYILSQPVQCVLKGQPHDSISGPLYRLQPGTWKVPKDEWPEQQEVVFEWLVGETRYLVRQTCTRTQTESVPWLHALQRMMKEGEMQMSERFEQAAVKAAETVSSNLGVRVVCVYEGIHDPPAWLFPKPKKWTHRYGYFTCTFAGNMAEHGVLARSVADSIHSVLKSELLPESGRDGLSITFLNDKRKSYEFLNDNAAMNAVLIEWELHLLHGR